ncbi:MAG: hypothetical protein K0S23_1851 [Fluviicola sp.]|uniref:hypothetical protein n=1 Tax=Fluviicola sp. TaxID=1917219 RepID=UPI002606CDA0|nr:hypothetical protein [Fluviicola sp.]MDF3027544.1 hypothetical protein [Fluviicola sp.]
MKRTSTLAVSVMSLMLVFNAAGQANTKWNLVNDPYYGFPNYTSLFPGLKSSMLGAVKDDDNISNIESRGSGPTGLRTEFFLNNWFGVGVDAIYSGSSVTYDRLDSVVDGVSYTNAYERKMSRVRIQARFNFHFPVKNKRLDMYGGIGIGSNAKYRKLFVNGVETEDNTGFWKGFPTIPISMRTCWGFRYYFSKFVGMNFEVGIGGPLISTGVSSRFGFKLPKIPGMDELSPEGDNLRKKVEDAKRKQEEIEKKEGELKPQENPEKQKLEEEKLQLEKEKLKLEQEKLELEKQKFEEEKKKLEEEKKTEEKKEEEKP